MVTLRPKSDWGLVLYLTVSFFVLLFIGQSVNVERGTVLYFLILLPPFIFPLTKLHYIVCNFVYKLWPVLLLLIIALIWGLKKHDLNAIPRLALFLFILSWLEISSLKIRIKTLSYIYLGLIASSLLIAVIIPNLNIWGLIPGSTMADGIYVWRISFFPNIATTAFLSLFMFFLTTKDKETFTNNKFVTLVAIYFVIFSFVRTAVIAMFAYCFIYYFFSKMKNKSWLFILSCFAALILNYIVAFSAQIMYHLQTIPMINRFLLRGYHNLSEQDIYIQMYRPWLWKQQITIFLNSPLWMGMGMYDFGQLNLSIDGGKTIEGNDSVSLLLGLLATYGISAILIYFYILYKNFKNSCDLDSWACAIFPIIIFISMQWGSIFHPASGLFVLYFLSLIKGKKGFL